MAKRVDVLIDQGIVLCMDSAHRIIDEGTVAVSGEKIVAVGPYKELHGCFSAKLTIDATGKLVMPGLIDTYGHGGHGFVKGLFHPDVGWPTNELYFHHTTEDWWYAEGLLSALERLQFGVTCGLTVVGGTPPRLDSPLFAHRQAQAILDVGIRGVVAVGPPDPLIPHLPVPWEATTWRNGRATKRRFTYDDALSNSVAFLDERCRQADRRVQGALAFPYLFGRQAAHPRFPFTYRAEHVPVMREKAQEIRQLSQQYGVILHSHAFGGSVAFALQHFGSDLTASLLGSDVLLAHCNGLSEDEIAVLGEHHVGVSVVPFTHENLLYGTCPVIELLEAGANVTISTDGTAPYSSYDLFKEIPRTTWAQWNRFGSQDVLPPGKALRMVTIDAARALGLDDEIGSLEPEKEPTSFWSICSAPILSPSDTFPGCWHSTLPEET